MFVHAVSCGLGGEGACLCPLNLCKFSTPSSVLSLRPHAAFRNAKMAERAEIADREGSSFGSGEEQVFYFSMSDAAIPKAAYARRERVSRRV